MTNFLKAGVKLSAGTGRDGGAEGRRKGGRGGGVGGREGGNEAGLGWVGSMTVNNIQDFSWCMTRRVGQVSRNIRHLRIESGRARKCWESHGSSGVSSGGFQILRVGPGHHDPIRTRAKGSIRPVKKPCKTSTSARTY